MIEINKRKERETNQNESNNENKYKLNRKRLIKDMNEKEEKI